MGAMLVGSAGSFCSVPAREDVKNFFSTHKVAAADQALKHAVERIDGCIELRALQEPQLKTWLSAQPNTVAQTASHQ
jgi:aminopeptidase N/puromycin-sensitive aminopeptidase